MDAGLGGAGEDAGDAKRWSRLFEFLGPMETQASYMWAPAAQARAALFSPEPRHLSALMYPTVLVQRNGRAGGMPMPQEP